jgi:predicted amidohydrolase YtcJ
MRITSRTVLATLTALSALAGACARPPRLAADLIITGAEIWTGNQAQPAATAVAVIGDRIVEVGGTEQIERWRGPNTNVLDAGGRRLIPGFNDACVRFVDGGTALDEVDLKDAATVEEFARRINERARAKPGEWLLGGQWDERRWTPPELPTRAVIDDVTNSSPVFVVRYDGRMALANAAALGRAGVTEGTTDPPDGAIVRGANGFPTGVLQGAAMDIVARVIPKVTPEQRLRVLKRALEHAESLGVTSVQDAGATYEDIAAYADLANRGELTVRVYAVPAEGGWYDLAKLGVHRSFGSPWLRIGAVRAMVDRSNDLDELRTRLMAADHAGLQLFADAAGDASASTVIGLLEDIGRGNGGRDRRSQIGGSRLAPADIERLGSVNAVVRVQPDPGNGALGPLPGGGIPISVGTGWPSVPLNPMLAIEAALARGLTVAGALAAYTSGSAFAEFQEGVKGTIAAGQLADMVVLSEDILSIPTERIKDVRVLTTIVGGRLVHQRKP